MDFILTFEWIILCKINETKHLPNLGLYMGCLALYILSISCILVLCSLKEDLWWIIVRNTLANVVLYSQRLNFFESPTFLFFALTIQRGPIHLFIKSIQRFFQMKETKDENKSSLKDTNYNNKYLEWIIYSTNYYSSKAPNLTHNLRH